jgi:RNA polymerase sigma-70 factor, ECF subfamily
MSKEQTTAAHTFNIVCLPHMDSMRKAALRLTRNPALADDLVQDSLIRALRYFDSYKSGTSVKAWLNTIVRNTFIDTFKKEVKMGEAAKSQAREAEAVSTSPERASLQAETIATVREAVEGLSESYRVVVRMVDLEERSYQATADALGIPIGTVMSRLHRGRKALAKALKGETHDMRVAA